MSKNRFLRSCYFVVYSFFKTENMLKYHLVLILSIFALSGLAQEPVQTVDLLGVRAVESNGDVVKLGVENKRAYPVALVFIDIGCVISQRMIPRLNEISADAKSLNVQFFGVVSNPKVHWQEAEEFKKEFSIEFPLLYDGNGDLAHRFNPTVVPEAYVVNIYDELIYHGRINDQYAAIGKYNKEVRHPDLINAIKAASKKEKPEVSYGEAKGCVFESWDNAEEREVNFTQDIEPIMRANCVSCHRPNEIGPFSLITYEDVSRRGRMIEYVTSQRYMPIWKATESFGHFMNEHRLSDYQIELIQKWVKQGKKEGDKEQLMPALEADKIEWKLGEPDLILKMEPYTLPASGEDQYRVFVMKDAIPKGKTIRAVDFKPGDPSVVHHTTMFVDYAKVLRKYDAEDPEPGYDAFEKGGTMEFGGAVPICGWAPGIEPYSYPEDVGFYVESKADFAFENHYHLSGKETIDQSYVGIYFADKPIKKYITGSIMGTQRLHIEAGDKAYKKKIWTYVPCDIELLDFTPHMHYIGTQVTITIRYPDGHIEPLIQLKNWDLRWQNVYTLREMKEIPKGSIIEAEFEYDNSNDNHDNPYYPAKDMFWGWGSNDEMCEVYFSYVPKKFEDYGKMLSASFATFEHTYDVSKRLKVTESNLESIATDYSEADLYSEKGQILWISIVEACYSDEILKVLESRKAKNRDNANFQINLSFLMVKDALFAMDEQRVYSSGEKAGYILYDLISKYPENWNAAFAYGQLLLESEEPSYMKEGAKALEKLLEWQETLESQDKFANTYWELGKYYYRLRQDEKAEGFLKKGLEKFPENADLKQELASEGRIVKKTLN